MGHKATTGIQKRDGPSLGKAGRQAVFLEHFAGQNFNISRACKKVKISRKTFYRWKEQDPAFSEAVEELVKVKHDLIEERLFEIAVKDRNIIALIFLSKALCGYVERTKVDHAIEGPKLSTDQIDAIVNAARISGIDAPRLAAPEVVDTEQNEQA